MRGLTGNQTLLLVDGIRLINSTFRYGLSQYFNTIDPFSIEKIEVLKGGGSVQYGSDALGRTIQVFTAEPNENSMAERLARTLKEDFNVKGFISFCESSEIIERVIKTYNDYRPHASLDYKTPKYALQSIGSQRLRWLYIKKWYNTQK